MAVYLRHVKTTAMLWFLILCTCYFFREESARLREDHPDLDFPRFKKIKTQIYAARHSHLPPIPTRVEDVVIAGEWAETVDHQPFLICNVGEADKILVRLVRMR